MSQIVLVYDICKIWMASIHNNLPETLKVWWKMEYICIKQDKERIIHNPKYLDKVECFCVLRFIEKYQATDGNW